MKGPSKYELMESIAARKRVIEALKDSIHVYDNKIKDMQARINELEALNALDRMLLNEAKD